jgi:hypothetical protein
MSVRTILLTVAILALAIFPATRCFADADDTAVDQLFSALRDHDFSAATAQQTGLKGVANVKVETLPRLNHVFIAGEGKPNPAVYDTPGHFDQAVIDAIANFVASSSSGSVSK